ncbi:DMT family transporter [Lonepinella sp. BR2882]|uniref:DMT family transporter n=1 Tax=Lonepinella sp. BR2882 TaxID=3095283 RepID=UPI003F6DAE00
MFSSLIGIAIGAGMGVQTVINSRLRELIGSPFIASFVSFTIGSLFLALIAALNGQTLWVSQGQFANIPWWAWLGRITGVFGLTANILLFPKLGGVQTTIMLIFGQVSMGMLVDTFGWFGTTAQAFGLNRLLGVVLVLIGVIIAVSRSAKSPKTSSNPLPNRLAW